METWYSAIPRGRSSLTETGTEGMCQKDCSTTAWAERAWNGQWSGLVHVCMSRPGSRLGLCAHSPSFCREPRKRKSGRRKQPGRPGGVARARGVPGLLGRGPGPVSTSLDSLIFFFLSLIYLSNLSTLRGARTLDHKIKSRAPFQLSQPADLRLTDLRQPGTCFPLVPLQPGLAQTRSWRKGVGR